MRFTRHVIATLVFAACGWTQAIPGRYIVELTEPPAAALQASLLQAGSMKTGRRAAEISASAEVEARRAAVRAGQQRVAAAIARQGGRVVGSTDTAMNALFVSVEGRSAADLEQLPGVRRVYPDRRFRAKLDRVAALSRVPQAWEKVGGIGKAGEGVGIAILDSGIDASHPGFQDKSLTPPAGYPKTSSAANRQYVSEKVAVARSYEEIADGEGYGVDAADRNGHGTNAACAAACVAHKTNAGDIAGAAPKAFLGAYKVLGDDGSGADSMILKGIDDAMKDGMDVLNLSLGTDMPPDPKDDPQVKALNAAVDAGYIVAVAAGNAGPDENTVNSPGTAEFAITVGSSSNDRELSDAGPKPIDPNRLSDFSSRGPNPGPAMKPDMAAVGDNFFTAQTTLQNPDIHYTVTQGTSFATPFVAGAAGVLKAARPGLTAHAYRSLLVNSSSEIRRDDKPAPIRHQGAGRLDLAAALDMPVAFQPTSVKFGVGGASASFTRTITVANVTDAPVTLELSVRSFDDKPAPRLTSPATVTLAAGASASIGLAFEGTGLTGEYQGVLLARNSRNSVVARVPYWYGVRSPRPAAITLLEFKGEGPAGGTAALGARVVDASGIDVDEVTFAVSTATPGADVVKISGDPGIPGVFQVQLKLAAGENEFVFEAGAVKRTVKIAGI